MLNFITRLLRHSQQVNREEDSGVHYDQIIDEMQEEAIRQCWILVRRDEEGLRQCSALVDGKMDVSSGKRWRTEEKVSKLLEPELSSEIPVTSSNPRTFRKYNQSRIARQCTVSRRFHVGNGKELRSIVNHGLIPRGVSLRMGRQVMFLHLCESDG